MSSQSTDPAAACPVDHKTRQVWLDKARSQGQGQGQGQEQATPHPPGMPPGESCDSSAMDQSQASAKEPLLPQFTRFSLDTSREVSTIPRAEPVLSVAPPVSHRPANNEHESGADAKSGNWIYPSEKMFFDAMKRKNFDPQEQDMRSIVPIHNAVNERAWKEIKEWERGRGADQCGGPRLVSFSGQSTALTPKARFNSVLGYAPPFDRHDWVVDRCGTQVDYVIDFYAGRDEGKAGKSLNFYLDVRPKLNTWQGWRMRAERMVGL